MENFFKFGLGVLLICTVLYSCSDSDDFEDFFDARGGSVAGVVLYRNYSNNQLDTAANATIQINPASKPTEIYVLEAAKGRFEANFLKDDIDYEVRITYLAHQFVYRFDTTLRPGTNKEEIFLLEIDQEKDYGLASLSGTLFYLDIETDTRKPASGAVVELRSGLKTLRNVADSSGLFQIENLTAGNYLIDYAFRQHIGKNTQLIYELTNDSINVTANAKKEIEVKTFEIDSVHITNPIAKVTVFDADSLRLGNASVFLYGNERSAKADTSRVASVATGKSNGRGIVLLDHLDKRDYFVYGEAIIGKDTLTNNGAFYISWPENIELAETKIYLK